MGNESVRQIFSRVDLCKCSDGELVQLFYILLSFNLQDLANQVADFLYIKCNPTPAFIVPGIDLEKSPPPLHNAPAWLAWLLPRFLWHQKP